MQHYLGLIASRASKNLFRFTAYKSEKDYENGKFFFMKDFDNHNELKLFSALFSYNHKNRFKKLISTYHKI